MTARFVTGKKDRSLDFSYRSDTMMQGMFHSHLEYEIYYFHEGKCNYLIGDRIYSLAPGDLILMNGMTLHCAKVDASFPYIRSIVHFEPVFVSPYMELPGAVDILKPFKELKNYRISLRGADKEEAERILLRMKRHQLDGAGVGSSRLALAFVDLLYFIYEKCKVPLAEAKEFPSEKEKHAQKIVTLLERSFTEDLHMAHIQEQMHMSRSYLAKVFKEVTGVTIFEYVYRKRIHEARALFRMDPKLSVTEVCFRLGFKHVAHFSRLFKSHVGVTPDAYRRGSA